MTTRTYRCPVCGQHYNSQELSAPQRCGRCDLREEISDLRAKLYAVEGGLQAAVERADKLRGLVSALIAVAEDCAAHDLYVAEGDAAVSEFRKLHPGRFADKSAGDHYRAAAETIRAARALLAEGT